MLSVETLVQCGIRSFSLLYFVEVMLLTKVYYTHAYNSEIKFYNGPNLRTQWYVRHRNFIRSAQRVYTIIAIAILSYFFIHYYYLFYFLSISSLLLIAIFPLLASMYYGILFLTSPQVQPSKLWQIKALYYWICGYRNCYYLSAHLFQHNSKAIISFPCTRNLFLPGKLYVYYSYCYYV